MLDILEKLKDVEQNNIELDKGIEVNIIYSFYHGMVTKTLKDGIGYEQEVNKNLDYVNTKIEEIDSELQRIENFKQDLLKIKSVMQDDKWRLENSIDKEVKEEFFTSYEIRTSTWKPYNKWEESEVIATIYKISNRKVIFESGNTKAYETSREDLYRIRDKWSNRKEFNKRVKELAKQYNATITK